MSKRTVNLPAALVGLVMVAMVVGAVVTLAAWVASTDTYSITEMPDGCFMYEDVTNTWWFDSETERTVLCPKG